MRGITAFDEVPGWEDVPGSMDSSRAAFRIPSCCESPTAGADAGALLTAKSKVKVKSIGRIDIGIQFQATLSKDMSLRPQVLAKGECLLKMIGML